MGFRGEPRCVASLIRRYACIWWTPWVISAETWEFERISKSGPASREQWGMATSSAAKPVRKPRKSSSASASPSTAVTRRAGGADATSLTFPFAGDQWPTTEYLAPLAFLRSALFGIVPKGRRKRFESQALASYGGYELRFTGEVLDQHDHDLWLVAIRQAREHGTDGHECPFHKAFAVEGSWLGHQR